MQKITPFLWFDNEAEEAVGFYVSVFSDSKSKLGTTTRYNDASVEVSGKPSGSIMTVDFELYGQQFIAINGGPDFEFTPAVSFIVACQSHEEVENLWGKLVEGGSVLMELDKYPFSEKYGWLKDKYGLSWQLMLSVNKDSAKQKITPFLMFTGNNAGRAEEAINEYIKIFHNAKIAKVVRYGKDEMNEAEGTIMHAIFSLEEQQFAAMDSSYQHGFNFNEAISFLINCKDQEEIDYYWNKLKEGGDEKAQICGWLKDRFGVSWQVAPDFWKNMYNDTDPEKANRAMKAMLEMKKIEIEKLKNAFNDN
ncbi:MAG: hypothetical protein ACD_56C00036G0003 [uncultured bacterium]|nr:MAG: hypothetical protein ACD_56C00036G0003 [uncultured bacterium]